MKIFFNLGLKLMFANLFGSIIHTILSLFGFLIFGSILFLLTVGNSIIELYNNHFNMVEVLHAFSFEKSPLWLISSLLVLFFYILYQLFVQSMIIGGLYGSAVHSIFEKKGSFRAYFSYSFRNLGKLMQLQCLLLIFSIPFIIFILIFAIGLESLIHSPNIIFFQTSFSVLFILIFCTLFLHSPIIIIKEKVSAWKSILHSFLLLKKGLYSILFSGFLFFAILALLNGIFLLIFSYLLFLTGVSPIDLNFDQLPMKAIFIIILGLIIWVPIIFPYSMICALLVLVKRYKLHLDRLITQSKSNFETI